MQLLDRINDATNRYVELAEAGDGDVSEVAREMFALLEEIAGFLEGQAR